MNWLEATQGKPMAFKNINFEIKEHIGVIRLDRPRKLNALNQQLVQELVSALRKLDANDSIRCVVLTGSEKVFSAGADIEEMTGKTFVEMYAQDHFSEIAEAFLKFRKPIIAAVAGAALGGGCELAMMCDIIIAAEDSFFGQPEISLGVIAGIGGTQRLTRAVGKAKAMEMHLTGRRMTADEAERSGLVSRLVPLRKLMDEAMATANKIAALPPLAVKAAKETVNRAEETSLREGLLVERRLFHAMFATEDQTEGMKAFTEKRQAHFRGR